MTAEEIACAAAKRVQPEQLDLPGQLLYAVLRRLYADYAFGLISLETGQREKARAIVAYEKASRELAFYAKAAGVSEARYRKTEKARSAARKNPCAETAVALADAIDGL